ncbi:MAG: AI-2E family transporter [Ruminococcus sp.]|jgi:predicted PurR-regulated permease PerM|nr:AI-2E family transporter [Ruminococcus sp.]
MNKKNILYLSIGAVIIIFTAALFFKTAVITSAIRGFLKVLEPVIIGIAIAFVLNTPLCRIKSILLKITKGKTKISTVLSVLFTYLFTVALLIGIFALIIPNLIKSFINLSDNFTLYYQNFLTLYERLKDRDTFGILEKITVWLGDFSQVSSSAVNTIITKTGGFVGGLFQAILGFIVSIYILSDKENIKKSVAEFLSLSLSAHHYALITKYYRLVFTTFSRFVSGQLTEALILGCLCYVGMVFFRFEYPLLISTLIAVTALIPVVGALIGTIPAAFLLLLVKPMDAVWFLVFIIILQQIENNIIYPRVVGTSVGLPSLLVLSSILIGAGLGGIPGTLLAVPVTAVLYAIINEYIAEKKAVRDGVGENI